MGERSIEDQLASISPDELKVVHTLKQKWESQKKVPHEFDDAMYLRFARCSPGPKKFNVETAWKVMKKYDGRYLKLSAEALEDQLLTKTLFIPPGLKCRDGNECFYMKPARYFPKKTPTSTIIDNLAYCMSVMVEKERSCTEGIGFVANMDDWTFTNFSVSYCLNFMKMLQGRIPVRVRLFLIVNPPSWFGSIWDVMKPMLAKDFQKKVHIIHASQLCEFLGEGYEQFLPNELEGGMANPEEIVNDFITLRKAAESGHLKHSAAQ
mmetsp:Transcript_5433/g.13600  ORF Transcript_5433/g.13600 Transcript_5433/m.13600 type:complete len:265 (+) Transcript_5433:232-1026(+)